MYRSIPYGNRLIQQKLDEKNQSAHLKKLEEIRRSVSRTSQTQQANRDLLQTNLSLRKNNKKKEIINELHFTEVERENRILLEKMSRIVNKNSFQDGIDKI